MLNDIAAWIVAVASGSQVAVVVGFETPHLAASFPRRIQKLDAMEAVLAHARLGHPRIESWDGMRQEEVRS